MKRIDVIRNDNPSLIRFCGYWFPRCFSVCRVLRILGLIQEDAARAGSKSSFLLATRVALLAVTPVMLLLFPLTGKAETHIQLPQTSLTSDDVAVIVNDSDPLSVQIGQYYRKARGIPAANMIHLRFSPGRTVLSREEFQELKAEIDQKTPAHVQAYAVAWTLPYRVDCMSLTSALAFGFDEKYCSFNCGATAASPYFNSPSHHPVSDHQLRPAMMLAGLDFEQVKSLIDRGVAADHTFPAGHAYLVITSDKARSARANYFEMTAQQLNGVFPIEILELFNKSTLFGQIYHLNRRYPSV